MKLTPRSQGYRFTHDEWSPNTWIDVKKVGRSTVRGIDQDGKNIEFARDEMDSKWRRLGGSTGFRDRL